MKREDIERFIHQQEAVYNRQYQNFQDTGDSKYSARYHRAEKLIDIARIALSSVDDHNAVGMYRAEISEMGAEAERLLLMDKFWEPEDMRKYLEWARAKARVYGLIRG